MAIVRWEPFRDLMSLQERMNRLFDESYRARTAGGQQEEDWALGGSWAPAVDIYEHDGNIVLKAEIPGVDAKAVDRSLIDMATKRPRTIDEFATVHGVGRAKLAEFADAFLEVLETRPMTDRS